MARRRDGDCCQGLVLTIWRVGTTGSTNTDLLARAIDGSAREGDWLVAEAQTAGRGRQGRAWLSPPGNLYASGLVELRAGDPVASTLALVAGIALHDALAVPTTALKWPNDVLVRHAKLAGILLERADRFVVVGAGANLAHHPELADRPTTGLASMGISLSPDEAVAALATSLLHWLAVWRADLNAIRAAWLERAHPIGTSLSAELPDGRRVTGGFDGLTEDCALRLRLADGSSRVIHAGDVFLI